jgi:hypothetical protein
MTTAGTAKKWEATTCLTLTVHPAQAPALRIADIHLLPARPGDFVGKEAARKRVLALRAAPPPVQNGSLDQPCWKNAAVLTDFYGYGGAKASDSRTNVRVCHDQTCRHVLFENLEPIETLGTAQKRDSAIWNSNHVELYLDPFRDGTQYFQILVDPAGTIEDLRVMRTGPAAVCGWRQYLPEVRGEAG